jgi:hypothetical protein
MPAAAQTSTEGALRVAADQAVTAASLSTADPTLAIEAKRRPAVLLPLYASYAALQMSDAALTLKALAIGGHETNGLMGGIVKHPLALYSIKAAVVGVAVFQSEKMWRQGKRKSAIATLIIVNTMYVFIVNHNRHVINELSR